ncbi:hypothetical protein [uncultured Boseongicola sp.]|uniref:hypothetical protein n=1 Tax=uncultured Boseongicola sp. TaxID=1648499 RepID=UPI0026035766|nr:hypothetical protein [uncultured Boseongicola sp.]
MAIATVVRLRPDRPLPAEWNPTVPLSVSDPYLPPARWKAGLTLRIVAGLHCGCSHLGRYDPVAIGAVSLSMATVEMNCSISLRLALWERHGLQGLAVEVLGADVTRIVHLSS